jgi:hypothetical protein
MTLACCIVLKVNGRELLCEALEVARAMHPGADLEGRSEPNAGKTFQCATSKSDLRIRRH